MGLQLDVFLAALPHLLGEAGGLGCSAHPTLPQVAEVLARNSAALLRHGQVDDGLSALHGVLEGQYNGV